MKYICLLQKSSVITGLFFLAFIMGSCRKSFLELSNPQGLTLDGTITDLQSLTNASTGVYNEFQNINYYDRTFILLPDLIGDNVFISRLNSGRYTNYRNLAMTNGDGYAANTWQIMWEVIVNANLCIAAGESLTFTPDEQSGASHVIGEMYAARALAYFDMVRLFAQPYNYTADASHNGVPVVITPPGKIINPPRASVKEVYEQIVKDLKQAVSLMAPGKRNGRFSQAAAQGLLAKVYLYMEDWKDAEQYATEVIENTNYQLLSNSNYVASWKSKYSSESLFEVTNTATDNGASDGIGYFYSQGGYGDALATKDLYDIYSATDVRRQLIQKGARAKVGGEDPAYIPLKYPNGAGSKDDDVIVLRLSEIYLIRAEARAEQGHDADAQADLNTIAQRSDPSAAAVTLTGDALVNRIILERRKELAFEGNRLFDLNRKKMDVNDIYTDGSKLFKYPDNKFILPIPNAEVYANPNMKQNPGY